MPSAAVRTASPGASTFAGIKASSWSFIVLITALAFGVIAAIEKTSDEEHGLLVAVYNGSAHLVTPTLIGAGLFAVFVLGSLALIGKLSLRDVGWKRENLAPALATTVALWIVMQLIEVIANFGLNGDVQLTASWSALAAATAVGVLLGQVLGTAVSEETLFRGFLLPQLRLKFTHMHAAVAIGLAIGVSQVMFALYHLPNLMLGLSGNVGTGLSDLTIQLAVDFAIGIVFAGVYIRTGNLFLVMGIHALQNAGTSLVATPIDPAQIMLALAVIVFVVTFVPALVRRFRTVGTSVRLADRITS